MISAVTKQVHSARIVNNSTLKGTSIESCCARLCHSDLRSDQTGPSGTCIAVPKPILNGIATKSCSSGLVRVMGGVTKLPQRSSSEMLSLGFLRLVTCLAVTHAMKWVILFQALPE